ncbi:ABC transporter permease [Streptomyces hirsutus]
MTTTTAPAQREFALPLRRMLHARESGVFAALVLLFVLGSILSPSFAQSDNLLSVGQQVLQIGIMAIGVTFVILNGEIDLSVGSTYALSAISTGILISDGWSWGLAAFVGLAVGAVAGLFNGLAVVVLGVPSFIVTLGTLSVFRGVALLISDGAPISLGSSQAGVADFNLLGQGLLFGVIPMQFVFFAVIAVIGAVLLSVPLRLQHLRRRRQPGSRPARRRQRQAGQADRVRPLRIHRRTRGRPRPVLPVLRPGRHGPGMELTVISAVIIGGAALFGGSGTIWGTSSASPSSACSRTSSTSRGSPPSGRPS